GGGGCWDCCGSEHAARTSAIAPSVTAAPRLRKVGWDRNMILSLRCGRENLENSDLLHRRRWADGIIHTCMYVAWAEFQPPDGKNHPSGEFSVDFQRLAAGFRTARGPACAGRESRRGCWSGR